MQLPMMVAEAHYCEDHVGHIICAVTWDKNKNTCEGDSGDPLACQESDGKWHLRGVLTFAGDNCTFWSGFSRVASFDGWIRSTISRK